MQVPKLIMTSAMPGHHPLKQPPNIAPQHTTNTAPQHTSGASLSARSDQSEKMRQDRLAMFFDSSSKDDAYSSKSTQPE